MSNSYYTSTSTNDVIMMSLFEYLGQAAGSELGRAVCQAAMLKGVEMTTHEVTTKTYVGKIMRYPKSFLDEYFKQNPV